MQVIIVLIDSGGNHVETFTRSDSHKSEFELMKLIANEGIEDDQAKRIKDILTEDD